MLETPVDDYIGDYTTQIVGDWNNPIIGNSQIAYLVGGWVCLNPSEKYFSSSIGMMFATQAKWENKIDGNQTTNQLCQGDN